MNTLPPYSYQTTFPDSSDLNLGFADPVDTAVLERPISQQLKIYDEMRRQAVWAFNLCCVFAALGVLQGIVGLAGVFFIPKVGLSLLISGGLFGALSTWGMKLSQNANMQLERITSHEKARELIDSISLPVRRDAEISKFVNALIAEPHRPGRVMTGIHSIAGTLP